MADRGQKDYLVDIVLDELHVDNTLTSDQYDRAWKAFRRMTESDLMLMRIVVQKCKAKVTTDLKADVKADAESALIIDDHS